MLLTLVSLRHESAGLWLNILTWGAVPELQVQEQRGAQRREAEQRQNVPSGRREGEEEDRAAAASGRLAQGA